MMKEIEGRLRGLKGTEHVFTTAGEMSLGRNTKGEATSPAGRSTRPDDRPREAATTASSTSQQAREILAYWPNLRTSVNDVSSFRDGRRQQTFQVNMAEIPT